jgi:hypothetical protein
MDQSMDEETIREQLGKAGIARVDIRPIGPSLEDVFVALTANNKNGRDE